MKSGEKVAIGIGLLLILGMAILWLSGVAFSTPEAGKSAEETWELVGLDEASPLNRERVFPDSLDREPGEVGYLSPPEEPPFTLRLINGVTGEAIPNHEVWLTEDAHVLAGGLEAIMTSQGKRLVTDAGGELRVPFKQGFVNFFARQGSLIGYLHDFGALMKRDGRSELILELHPEHSLSIRVIDQQGTPIPKVPISQRILDTKVNQKSVWESSVMPPGASIGLTREPDGILTWPEFALAEQAKAGSGKEFYTLRLHALIPGQPGLHWDFSPIPPHNSTVDLQIPTRLGEMTLRVIDALGDPLAGPLSIKVSPLVLDTKTGEWTSLSKNGINKKTQDGIATIPAVALGLKFRAYPPGFFPPKPWEFDGPTSLQPKITRELQLGEDLILFRGRALDHDLKPLAGSYVWLKLKKAGKAPEDPNKFLTSNSRTDSEGRFNILSSSECARVELESATVTANSIIIDLESRLPLREGVNNLGDLIFRPDAEALILSGMVIPAPNAPCKNFSIEIEHRGSPTGKWQASKLRARIDKQSFVVRGELQAGEYRAKVSPAARCHVPPDPIVFTPGQEGLEISLERGHTLTVSTRVPDASEYDFGIRPLYALLRPTGGSALQRIRSDVLDGISLSSQKKLEGDALEIYWNGLIEGVYQLELRLKGLDSPLEVISGIQVPGSMGRVAKADLDLSRHLRGIEIDILSADDTVAEKGASVQVFHKGEFLTFAMWSPEKKQVRVVPGETDLWINCESHDPVLLRGPSEDTRVLLTPSGAELSVRVFGVDAIPPDVGVRISFKSSTDVPPGSDLPSESGADQSGMYAAILKNMKRVYAAEVTLMLDDAGQAEGRLHRRGAQSITVELVPKTKAMRDQWERDSVPVEGFSPRSFELRRSATPQQLQLNIPQSAIDAALQKAGVR